MSVMCTRQHIAALLIGFGLLSSPAIAQAQGFAILGGANINPDQLFAGGRYEMPLLENVWFQPGADAGFGDHTKLFAVNLEATVRKSLERHSPWMVYAGGGPAMNHYRWAGSRETKLGFNLLGGLRHSNGVFTEFRVGLVDSPDFRFAIGIMFKSL
jgi:hypothetical protein